MAGFMICIRTSSGIEQRGSVEGDLFFLDENGAINRWTWAEGDVLKIVEEIKEDRDADQQTSGPAAGPGK